MARINMEEIIEELDENFTSVLKSVFDKIVPDNTVDSRRIMRVFRMKLERGFAHWEYVPDRCVDMGY